MGKKTMTAGKTAMWKNVSSYGRRALRSPEGCVYFGTAKEVCDAGLLPWERDSLAEKLRGIRRIATCGALSRDFTKTAQEDERRLAIMYHIASLSQASEEERNQRIMATAAARYMGQTYAEFLDIAIRDSIEGTIELAQSENGGPFELPLTRREREAFTGKQSDYSDAGARAGAGVGA